MKKILCAMLTVVMAVSMVACKPADSATPSSDAAPTPSGTAPAGESDLATIEKDAELVYWTMWNEAEPQGTVIAEAVAAFTEKTGVKVEVNFNGREIRKTLQPALDAKETIDLFDEDIERVANPDTWGKYLLDLTSRVDASYDGKVYRDQVNKTLIDLAQDISGGAIKNIPYQPSTFVVMYNKDLFDKAGVAGIPKTWEEFTAACDKLVAAGITPLTVDDAYMAAFFGYNLDRLVGAEKCAEMVKNVDFKDPAVLEFATIWEDAIKKGYMSKKAASNIFPAGQVEELAVGKAAMYLNGTWLPNEIKMQAPDLNWGSFAWPSMKGGDGIEANNFGAQSFGINKDTKYPNAAFALVRWLTTGEWDQKLSDESLGVPMANDATWPKQIAEAKTVIDTTTKRLSWAVGMEDKPEINAAIKENFAKLIKGDINAQGFADAMGSLKAAG